jgi:predicted alpha/beta hydrolase family esterase
MSGQLLPIRTRMSFRFAVLTDLPPRDAFDELTEWLDAEWKAWIGVPKSVLRRRVETVVLVAYGLTCAGIAVAYERVEDAAETFRRLRRR